MFSAATFELGRAEFRHASGERFWITDRERSVVDAFRLRPLLGETAAHHALGRYLRQARSQRARLSELARELRASTALHAALRVLDA